MTVKQPENITELKAFISHYCRSRLQQDQVNNLAVLSKIVLSGQFVWNSDHRMAFANLIEYFPWCSQNSPNYLA